jgi:hypothetical protein
MSLSNLIRHQRNDLERVRGRAFSDAEWRVVEDGVMRGLVHRIDAVQELSKTPIVVELDTTHVELKVRFVVHEADEAKS